MSGAAPLVVNTGNFEKTAGTGTTIVDINFENLGHIIQQSGHLNIAHPVSIGYMRQFGKRCASGDPVECASGNYTEPQSDFAIGGRGVGLDLTRAYSAQAAAAASSPGAFGYGWTNSFSDHLISEESGKKITLVTATGSTITFTGGPGSFTAPAWTQDVLSGSAEAGYTLTLPEQTKYIFSGSGRLESVSDRNGNKTSLAYNKSGQLETITDPAGRKITLTYNGEGLVEIAKDPIGHVVKYTYESKNLKTVTLPGEASASWQFKYDASHRVTSKTDGRGGKTTNEYDSSSRVISQTDPAGRTLTFKYEPFHTTITNQATGAVTDEWFTSNNEPYSITRGYGTADATTEAFSYNAAGRLTSVTDGNGHTTTYGYDAEGNRTREENAAGDEREWAYNKTHDVTSMTTPRGETTTIERDANGNIESVSRPGPEETTQTTTYAHDEHGQLESVTDPLERTWSYGYDSQGNRTSESDPAGGTQTFGYDGDSRLTSVVAPRGNLEGAEPSEYETTIERDAQGRPKKVTDPLGHTTDYGYDANGNLSTLTDPRGHTSKFTYNADDEQTKVEKPNGAILKTGYDGAGEMTSQTDGNEHATTYVRNVLEQPVEVVDPLGRRITAEFDAAGNLKSATDPTERTTSYTYDPANRLTKISYSGGTTPAVEYGYDADGNLTSMVDGTGESSFVYDQLGRLTSSQDGHGDVVGYGYDLASDPTGITYPNGKSIARAFDSAGRLESVTDWLGGTTSFTYGSDSNLEAVTFPAGSANVDEYSYDHADQLSEAKFTHGAETLTSLSYSRDKAGAIESEIRKGLPGPEELGYGYDENGRLTEVGEASFEYDAADNLTKGLGSTNTYDAASQLETGTGVSFSYDKLGRRTKATPGSGPATSFEYDQTGNLISVERPEEGEVPAINESLAYDGSGLLASKTRGMTTNHLIWDTSEGLPLLLDDGQNSYIYGPGGLPVEQISSEEKPTYLHHDQLGSTRLLTNASGEASATFSYGPYGALGGKTGVATTPLGFAGQYTDPETGLQYLRARFYDPATAQFLTRDPLEAITREPYAYAFNSPLNLTDPSGRIAGAAAGCAIGEVVEPAGGCVPGAAAGAAASVAAAGAAAAAGAIAGSLSSDEEILGHLTISKSLAAKLAAEANGNQEATCEPSEMPNFEDSSQPPGPGWEWKGSGSPGSSEGSWFNPGTGESLHPDLEHEGEIGPHYDYHPGRRMPKYRVFPDGRVIPSS
jgi:RHS repeat-associated protein